MKYFDISPLLSSLTAVFPGDKAFSRSVALDFKKGHNLTLSSIESSLHIGAHTDAPNHYHADGQDIGSVPLKTYMGLAQVIEVKKNRGSRIEWSDLKDKKITTPRVLFKTLSFPNPNEWNGDFVSLSPGVIHELAKLGVVLVGIDTPSVDPSDDKILETHNAIYRHKLAILEGIVLDEVNEGTYTLVALPLKIQDADASPVRAILIQKEIDFS